MDRINEAVQAILGNRKLSRKVRKFMKLHGEEPITSITMYRAPIGAATNAFSNLLTLGSWDRIKREAEIDKLFHTGIIINGKYLTEKNATIEIYESGLPTTAGLETHDIPVSKKVSIAQMFDNAENYMGEQAFIAYDAYKNNCQSYVQGLLRGSGLMTPSGNDFIQQDIQKLIDKTPAYSTKIAKSIIDFAGMATNIVSALKDKRGGVISLGKRSKPIR